MSLRQLGAEKLSPPYLEALTEGKNVGEEGQNQRSFASEGSSNPLGGN